MQGINKANDLEDNGVVDAVGILEDEDDLVQSKQDKVTIRSLLQHKQRM